MISSKLLSKIIGESVKPLEGTWSGLDNVISTNLKFEFSDGSAEFINVYELMNRCKILASKKGFPITVKVDEDKATARLYTSRRKFKVFVCRTEYEVVFKSCEGLE